MEEKWILLSVNSCQAEPESKVEKNRKLTAPNISQAMDSLTYLKEKSQTLIKNKEELSKLIVLKWKKGQFFSKKWLKKSK